MSNVAMQKLRVLSGASKFDVCTSSASPRKASNDPQRIGAPSDCGICHSFNPRTGTCISMLKTLYSNSCVHDCSYCPNSTSAKCGKTKTQFEPEELARLFMQFYVRNYIEGLFLSSGVAGDSDLATEKIIDVARLLRIKFHFQGYMHLKVLPGVSRDHLSQLAEYADRVSLNLEAPSKSRLHELSSTKDFGIDIVRRLDWLRDLSERRVLQSGHTTQFVLGPSDESDLEYLKAVQTLYSKNSLRRAYYSAFEPVRGTGLEGNSKTPLVREHRLYEADWLLRVYGFSFSEVVSSLDENNNLPLNQDVKTSFAQNHSDLFPVDVNSAAREELVRVPGIGLVTAERIVLARQQTPIASRLELKNMGVVLKRAEPFLEINGKRQMTLASFN